MKSFLNYLKLIPSTDQISDSSSQMTNQKKKKNLLVLKAMIPFECISKKWAMLSCFPEKVKLQLLKRIESGLR